MTFRSLASNLATDNVHSDASGEAAVKSSHSPTTRPPIWLPLQLPDVSLARPSRSPPENANTWEPCASFGPTGPAVPDLRPRNVTPARAGSKAPPRVEELCPAMPAPSRNAQTFAMGRRIESDLILYRAALRFMDATPAPGRDATCDLALRLHAMMQAHGEETAGGGLIGDRGRPVGRLAERLPRLRDRLIRARPTRRQRERPAIRPPPHLRPVRAGEVRLPHAG